LLRSVRAGGRHRATAGPTPTASTFQAARSITISLFRSAPGLLLLGWCGLIVALIVVRHRHATRLPAEMPYETVLAYDIGSTDLQTIIIGLLVAVPLALLWLRSTRVELLAPVVAEVTVRWRYVLAASAAGVSVLTFLMLFRPLPDEPGCEGSRVVHLNAHMGIAWSCDSSLFQQVADNPARLLDAGHPRQSRPVYALIGFVLVQTFGRLAGWLGFGQWNGDDARPYVSLVLLNVLVLIAAVAVFARLLLSIGTPVAVTAALAVPVALNGLTVEWTLTPHQQTFAMLVPVVTVLAARSALLDPPGVRTAAWWGLGIGLGASAYGSWIVAVPVIVVALFIRLRLAAVRRVIAFLAAFAAPVVGWIAVCKIVAGSYYNHEAVVYRQFVWVLDSLRLGPTDLWHRTTSYLLLTVREVLGTFELWIAAAVIAVGVVIAVAKRIQLSPSTPRDTATLTAVGLTLVTTLLFLWAIGYYTPRLSIALFPPLLIVAGWVFSRLIAGSAARMGRLTTVAAAVGVAAWLGFLLT
jgi:hypothetical protein